MKKIVVLGALTGAVALTGLAGAAYAADGGTATATTTASASVPGSVSKVTLDKPLPKGKGIVCLFANPDGAKLPGKVFKGEKPGLVKIEKGGKGVQIQKFEAAKPVPGAPKGAVTIRIENGKGGVPAKLPDGAHCTQVPAGTTPPDLQPLPPPSSK